MSETMDEGIIKRLTEELKQEREGVIAQNLVVISLTRNLAKSREELSTATARIAELTKENNANREAFIRRDQHVADLISRIAELQSRLDAIDAQPVVAEVIEDRLGREIAEVAERLPPAGTKLIVKP